MSVELIADKPLIMSIAKRQVQYQAEKDNAFLPASVIATSNGQYHISEKDEEHRAVKAWKDGDISGYESRSEAAQAVANLIARNVDGVSELNAMFKSSVFFTKNYRNGEGWNIAKEKATYTKAFQAKKEWLALNGGNTFTISANTACRLNSFLDDAVEVDLLPENTYAKKKLRMDFSVYPADHLVMKYANYIRERTNTYIEYSVMAIYYIVSVLTCGKAVFTTGYTPRYDYCNLWVMIMGFSSISRKTTTIDNAKDALEELLKVLHSKEGDNRYPESLSSPGSREGFAQELSEHEVRYFIQDEAAGFISRLHQQNMAAMLDDLCKVYDNKGFHVRLSKLRKKDVDTIEYGAENPYLPIFMATTQENFRSVTTRLDFTSGFLMRYLFAAPEYEKDNYKSTLTEQQKRELYDGIFNILLTILKFFRNQQGECPFEFTAEAKTMVEEWGDANEQRYFSEGGEKADVKLSYGARLAIYARKLAVLNHIMTPDFYKKEKTFVPVECMKLAIHLCENYFMPCFLEIEDSIGRSKNNLQNKILSFLKEHNGRCTQRELQRFLHITKKQYGPELEALIENQEIEMMKQRGSKGPDATYFQLLTE